MSELKILKIVLDTNIWISFLIGKKLSSLKEAIINNAVQIIFSAGAELTVGIGFNV